MTDNTQEIDETLDGLHENGCSVIEGLNYPRSVAAGMYKCDCSVLAAKQALLDWNNKQIESVLDRLIASGDSEGRIWVETIKSVLGQAKGG